jgi:acyl-CoA dehydrogenase
MDFAFDARTEELRGQLQDFIDEQILPAEEIFEEQAWMT